MTFKDHFSAHAKKYSQARPTYPAELLGFVSSLPKEHDLAVDIATGSGQAAIGLSKHFKKVIAQDASREQIENAIPKDNITYQVATAENTGLDSNSVDLITVAQALHWFDFDAFYTEVYRVLKPNGILAVWTYGLMSTNNEAIDQLIHTFYSDIVGDYWPPERRYVAEEYSTIPFPFETITTPEFTISLSWSVTDLLNYLKTWSAVQRYQKENGGDIVDEWMKPKIEACYSDGEKPLAITIPLILKVGSNS